MHVHMKEPRIEVEETESDPSGILAVWNRWMS